MIELHGVAVVWGDETIAEDGRETFAPYAFLEPVTGQLKCAHDRRRYGYYASTARRDLRLWQNDTGLAFAAALDPVDPDHRALIQAIRGGLRGMSFAFRPVDQAEDGTVRRARLSEVSVTGDPAYTQGGCWLADERTLEPRLEWLRQHFHADARTRQPARVQREQAAFARAERWAASLGR